MRKRFLAMLLSAAMFLGLFGQTAYAAEFTDISGHWAQGAVNNFVSYGVISGYPDGSFKPDGKITRAEISVILERLMGYLDTASNQYEDLEKSAWYTEPLLKAAAANVFAGYPDGTMRPNANITRAEALRALAVALGVPESTKQAYANEYIPDWAVQSVNGMAAHGYLEGVFKGNFAFDANITRAEVLAILDNAVEGYLNHAGSYSKDTASGVLVNTSGAVLKDMTVGGDLMIAEGVGNGEVVLDSVTVAGTVIVRGGGKDSVIIRGNSHIAHLVVAKNNGPVSVKIQENAVVDTLAMEAGTLFVSGSVQNLTVMAGTKVNAVGANVQNLVIEGKGATLTLDSASKVKNLTANAQVTVENKGTISNVHINASGTVIKGNSPDTVTVASGVKDVTLPDGTKSTVSSVSSPRSNGPHKGGSSSNNNVPVESIALDQSFMYLGVGQKYLFEPVITPSNAKNKTIAWHSSNPDVVAVDDTGTVKALDFGTATITATTEDGGKTATCDIMVMFDLDASDGISGDYVMISNLFSSEWYDMPVLELPTGPLEGIVTTPPASGKRMAPEPSEPYAIPFSPRADLSQLKASLASKPQPYSTTTSSAVGDVKTFKVLKHAFLDNTLENMEDKPFELLVKGEHCYVWADVFDADYVVTSAMAVQIANEYDQKSGLVIDVFGDLYNPANDGMLNILLYDIQDNFDPAGTSGYIGGYFNPWDFNPEANHAAIIHIDTYPLIFYPGRGVTNSYSVLFHELQHLINDSAMIMSPYIVERLMPAWLNEAMSMAAEEIVYPNSVLIPRVKYYNLYGTEGVRNGRSLYGFHEDDNTLGSNLLGYSLSGIFAEYLKQQTGGTQVFTELLNYYRTQPEPTDDGAFQWVLAQEQFADTGLADAPLEVVNLYYRITLFANMDEGIFSFHGAHPDSTLDTLEPIVFYNPNGTNLKPGGTIVVQKLDPNVPFYPSEGVSGIILFMGITLPEATPEE